MFLFCAHLAFLWLWDFLLKVPLILLFCYLYLITPFTLYCYPKVLLLNTVIFTIFTINVQPITSLKLNTHFHITLKYGRSSQHAFPVSVSLSFSTWTLIASNHFTDPGAQWTHLHWTVTPFLLPGTLSLLFTLFFHSNKWQIFLVQESGGNAILVSLLRDRSYCGPWSWRLCQQKCHCVGALSWLKHVSGKMLPSWGGKQRERRWDQGPL